MRPPTAPSRATRCAANDSGIGTRRAAGRARRVHRAQGDEPFGALAETPVRLPRAAHLGAARLPRRARLCGRVRAAFRLRDPFGRAAPPGADLALPGGPPATRVSAVRAVPGLLAARRVPRSRPPELRGDAHRGGV